MKRKQPSGTNPPSNRWFRNGTIYLLLLAVLVVILFRASSMVPGQSERTDLTTLAQDVKAGRISAIEVSQDGST